MKTFFLIFGSLLCLVLTAMLFVPSFLNWSSYAEDIAILLEKTTGQEVSLNGPVTVRLLPQPVLSARQVSLGQDDQALTIEIGRLDATIALGPLFSGRLDVQALSLERADLRVRPDALNTSSRNRDQAPGGFFAPEAISLRAIEWKLSSLSLLHHDGEVLLKLEQLSGQAQAQNLLGPWTIRDGAGQWGQHSFVYQLASGRYQPEQGWPLSLAVVPANADLEKLVYKGHVSVEKGLSYAGDIRLFATKPPQADTASAENTMTGTDPFVTANIKGDSEKVRAEAIRLFWPDPALPLEPEGRVQISWDKGALLTADLALGSLSLTSAPLWPDNVSLNTGDLLSRFARYVEALPQWPLQADIDLQLDHLTGQNFQGENIRFALDYNPERLSRWTIRQLAFETEDNVKVNLSGQLTDTVLPDFQGQINVRAPVRALLQASPEHTLSEEMKQTLTAADAEFLDLSARLSVSERNISLYDLSSTIADQVFKGSFLLNMQDETGHDLDVRLSATTLYAPFARFFIHSVSGQNWQDFARIAVQLDIRNILAGQINTGSLQVEALYENQILTIQQALYRSGSPEEQARITADGFLIFKDDEPLNGSLNASVRAASLISFMTLAESLFPGQAVLEQLEATRALFEPANLQVSLQATPRQNATSDVTLALSGQAGLTKLEGDMKASQIRPDPDKAFKVGQAATLSLDLQASSDDLVQFLSQAGLRILPVIDPVPASLLVKAEGQWGQSLLADITFESLQTRLHSKGPVEVLSQSSVSLQDHEVELETQDLALWADLLGLSNSMLHSGTPLSVTARMDYDDTGLELKQLQAQSEGARVEGQAQIQQDKGLRKVNARLNWNRLDLATMTAFFLNLPEHGNSLRHVRALPLRLWPYSDTEMTLQLQSQTGLWYGRPLAEDLSFDVIRRNTILDVQNVQARWQGSTLTGQGTLLAIEGEEALSYASQWQFKDVPAATLTGLVSDQPQVLQTTLHGSVALQGRGNTLQQWLDNATGQGTFTTAKGTLTGFSAPSLDPFLPARDDEVPSGEALAARLQSQFLQGQTSFAPLAGSFLLDQASIRLGSVTMQLDEAARMIWSGTVDMAEETVALTGFYSPDEQDARSAGETAIPSEAGQNEADNLAMPPVELTLAGPFGDLSMAVNAQALASFLLLHQLDESRLPSEGNPAVSQVQGLQPAAQETPQTPQNQGAQSAEILSGDSPERQADDLADEPSGLNLPVTIPPPLPKPNGAQNSF
jgi:hypothetical protein